MGTQLPIVEVRRTVEASVETVFALWTQPEQLRRWWSQTATGRCVECDLDLRVGGRYRWVLEDPVESTTCISSGEFREIESPRRLLFTWAADTHLGSVSDTLVEVELESHEEGRTEVVVRHRGLPDTPVGRSHEEGWKAILASLGDRLRPPLERPEDRLLDEVLHRVDIQDALYVRSEMTSPWGIELDAAGMAFLHVLLDGTAQLELENGHRMELKRGDLVLLPHGSRHVLRDGESSPVRSLADLFEVGALDESWTLRGGGGGDLTRMVCAAIAFADRRTEQLFSAMPRLIRVPGSAGQVADWLRETLERVGEELQAGLPGGQAVVVRLTDVIFIRAIRLALASGELESRGWLRGLQDPQVAAALVAIHQAPSASWTVGSLAAEARMSRSGFAARFTELVGQTPARYLAEWRLRLAAGWLRSSEMTVAEVSARVGYQSESSFSRAFRRFTGVSPGTYRRRKPETASLLGR